MTTFVDTSALYALVDEDDEAHRAAVDWLGGPGRDTGEFLVTHDYVVVETLALVKRRLGAGAVRVMIDAFIPMLSVRYVDEPLHGAALRILRATAGQKPSLVDRVSFEFMRHRGIERVFSFDQDFQREGFELVP